MKGFKSFVLSLVALAVLAVAVPAEAGLRDRLGGGGGAAGGRERPIGFGLKKPNAEVGEVQCQGPFCKMYAAGDEATPEQPGQPATEPAKENDMHPLVYLLVCCPFALLFLIAAPTGTYFIARKIQESDSDD